MKTRILILMLLMTIPGWCDSSVVIGGIRWQKDYSKALAQAKQLNKPLWVHFGEHPG